MIARVSGAKQRIIDGNRYKPAKAAVRRTRTHEKSGIIQTHKKKGDIILTSMGKYEVPRNGWY